ncbi:thioredoxin-disulfide reductase [Anaerotalea alkaliphila]|uniref:Thioredoxin reductase n=1 Tax=Anaerotalea alkaliphila TaxID=2662126 RepID=A0A7X5HV58_9FIRM|nr:thioredoxin-disulfide reductase [Anaerotalea alkaliphila]NDL67223.1 thioredoxin-disulfide reductase [Anaerotalea alkaliphila]
MEQEEKILDLVIIGAGPAGMAAAIYAKRAMMDFVILEKAFPGGQITNTYEIENYPGIKTASGFELSNLFREHVEELGVEILTEEVEELVLEGAVKKVVGSYNTYLAKTVILAMGASWKKLGVKGEEFYMGRGVSYCATCDGAFYRGKKTLVVGGGDVAVEDAIYLARMCEKVYLVHRRNELRAVKVLQEKLFGTPNIEVLWDTEMDEIQGGEFVEKVRLHNNKTRETRELDVDGVFVAVGSTPNTKFLAGKVEMDAAGWIRTGENCMTNVEGVFAAGDLRQKTLRQVITAAGDGATAVYGVERFL